MTLTPQVEIQDEERKYSNFLEFYKTPRSVQKIQYLVSIKNIKYFRERWIIIIGVSG